MLYKNLIIFNTCVLYSEFQGAGIGKIGILGHSGAMGQQYAFC